MISQTKTGQLGNYLSSRRYLHFMRIFYNCFVHPIILITNHQNLLEFQMTISGVETHELNNFLLFISLFGQLYKFKPKSKKIPNFESQ